jgi:alpha-tubulin suppressor-like RCC1 family protein
MNIKFKGILIPMCLVGVMLFQALTAGAQPVTKIAAGGGQSLFIKADGSLWVMGNNGYGELGLGALSKTNLPQLIVGGDVTAVAAGKFDSLFLKSDGSLWGMGYNYGELGDGTYNATNRPEQILASGVTAMAAGHYSSYFIKNDGSLWAMGTGSTGELGDGTYDISTNVPEQIVASNVTAVAGGERFSLFIKSDGSLWAMGLNNLGQLGDGTINTMTNRPEQVVASNVTAVACGQFHGLFLKNDGSLWGMGNNTKGQIGPGNIPSQPTQIVASNVVAIAAGESHSLFLKTDGSLWGMGDGSSGQLGIINVPLYGPIFPTQIVASNVVAIAAGVAHSLFVLNDGSLWVMGSDSSGQLGDGRSYGCNAKRPERIYPIPARYNQISGQAMNATKMRLSFAGLAGASYALDRSFSLTPPNWIPQATNFAGPDGIILFTNTPNTTTNNFWRIRAVQ